MSFSKGNSDSTKTPWVEVRVPTNNENGSLEDETERLLDQSEERPTVEAVPCIDPQQMECNEVEDYSEYPQAKVVASGSAGCILGCLMGGVACAVMGGLGSAYAAKHKGGTCAGDTARAMGEVATIARQKAIAVDEKYDVAKTTKEAAKTSFEKAKAMDQKYSICERTKNAVISTGKTTIDFAARHRLVERSVEGVGRGLEYVGGKITTSDAASTSIEGSVNSTKSSIA